MERNNIVVVKSAYTDAPAPDGSGPLHLAVLCRHYTTPVSYWNVVLCHSTLEMATEFDLVLNAGTVTPYPLIAMREAYAQVLDSQIVKYVSSISDVQMEALNLALETDGASLEGVSHASPLPFGSPMSDPRWTWMQEWVPALTSLSTPVRRLLF